MSEAKPEKHRRVPRRDQHGEDLDAVEELSVGFPLEFDEGAQVKDARSYPSLRQALARWREKREHRNFASDEEWGVDDE